MNTLERIDQLSNERSQLYRLALGERRKDPELKQRIADITMELERLWEVRRRERIGKLEGIDLIVEQSYVRAYGDQYQPTAPIEERNEVLAA